MNVSAANSAMYGILAAQGMSGAAAQAAAVTSPAAGSSDGQAAQAVQVAVLQKALDTQRGLINILA